MAWSYSCDMPRLFLPPEGEFDRNSDGLELAGAATAMAIGWATTAAETRAECATEEASSSNLLTFSLTFS